MADGNTFFYYDPEPHPSYGSMFRICGLNPTEATYEQAKSFLSEAHALAVANYGVKDGASSFEV